MDPDLRQTFVGTGGLEGSVAGKRDAHSAELARSLADHTVSAYSNALFEPWEIGVFTCFIRYKVDPDKLDEFGEYARSWMSLIRKYGGSHHGYFLPGRKGDSLPDAPFSFPGLGTEGPTNIAISLFSFANIEAYDRYRQDVSEDEACKVATSRFNETKCFSRYERTFLVPIFD